MAIASEGAIDRAPRPERFPIRFCELLPRSAHSLKYPSPRQNVGLDNWAFPVAEAVSGSVMVDFAKPVTSNYRVIADEPEMLESESQLNTIGYGVAVLFEVAER